MKTITQKPKELSPEEREAVRRKQIKNMTRWLVLFRFPEAEKFIGPKK